MNPTKVATRLAVLLLVGAPYFASAAESGKLTVQGGATLHVEPNFVTVTFSLSSKADGAVEANREVAETMKRLLEVARRQDIPDVDLKTSGITIAENRDRRDDCSTPDIQAWQSLTVILRKLDQIETLIDEMVEAGGFIQSVQPGVDDMEAHKRRALELAIDNAREQAGTVADQLGIVMGGAIAVSFAVGTRVRADTLSFSRSSARTYLPGMIPVSQRRTISGMVNERGNE